MNETNQDTPEQKSEILIVDPDASHAAHLAESLQSEASLHVVHSGRQGLDFLQRQPVQLLLASAGLPDIPGVEFLDRSQDLAPQAGRILCVNPEEADYRLAENESRLIYDLLPSFSGASRCRSTVRRALEYQQLNADYASLKSNWRTMYQRSLSAITDILEAKDPYTYGHSYRVTHYALAIARHMDLSIEQLESLELGGLLHDIGKVGIPETVLNKPGALTEAEYELVKAHPNRGFAMLWRLPGLESALQVVRHHHERYDGRGYPDGLAGEEIPLLARILAVADAYDAMTSKRPYRPALDHAQAIQEIERHAGTQFDPRIAALFINLRELGAARRLIETASDLPSFSPIVQKAIHLVNQPEPDMAALADILTSDPGITAKILRVVNSAYYGLSRQIVDLRLAISYLGLNEISKLVLSLAAQPLLSGEAGCSLWQHSLTCAIGAENLARRSGRIDPGQAFLAGLLHDIGKVLLLQYFPHAYQRARLMVASGISAPISEVIVFGVDHAEIGAWWMERWEMPAELVNAVRFHHVRELSTKPLTRLVTLADALAHYFSGQDLGAAHQAELFDVYRLNPLELDKLQAHINEKTGWMQAALNLNA